MNWNNKTTRTNGRYVVESTATMWDPLSVFSIRMHSKLSLWGSIRYCMLNIFGITEYSVEHILWEKNI